MWIRPILILTVVVLLPLISCEEPPSAPDQTEPTPTSSHDDRPSSGENKAARSTRISFSFEGRDMETDIVEGRSVGTYIESVDAITRSVVKSGRVNAFLIEEGVRRAFPITVEIDRDGDGSADLAVRKTFGYARGFIAIKYRASKAVQDFSFIGTQTVRAEIIEGS